MLKNCLQSLSSLPYRVSAPWRRLPDFLLIGAQKSGTTSLFHYLSEHPGVAVNPRKRKEVYFFNKDYARGSIFYRQYFPLNFATGLVGEGSTVYLHCPDVPPRVAALLPEVKLLAVLREPAARAVSHYYHHVQRGRETRVISEAFKPELIERWLDGQLEDGLTFRYLNNGKYVCHLKRWLESFPSDQLLILNAEELFARPQQIYDRVCGFLALSPFQLQQVKALNRGGSRQDNAEVLERLHSCYSSSVKELMELDMIDFQWEPYG